MNKLEFTNKVLDNLNDSISEDGKVGLAKFIELTNKLYEAINYTYCCTELKAGHKISFNDWLRVNYEPTRNKNLFIKNKKLQTRFELISIYEKE